MLDDFVDVIFPLIRESLYVATLRQKVIFVKLIFKHAHTLFHQFTERVKHSAHKHFRVHVRLVQIFTC